MSASLVAGVDSSTQSTKIVVCEADTGRVVRQGRAPHPDGTSVDPAAWWSAFEEASSSGLLDGVEAIAVGGQQHGMLALDDEGQVVRDALLWNDTRSADAADDLVRELGGNEAWVEAVGLVPGAAVTVAKVRWLAQHEPDSARRLRTVVLPHDWISGRILADGATPARWFTDRGDASGTGYFSAVTDEYRRDLQELALGRTFETPAVLAPSEAAGRTGAGMLVAAGTGDNMGAGLGLGLTAGDVVVSLGTSGTVFAVSDTPTKDPSGAIMGFADATGRHLPLMCTLNAARVLTATATMLGTDVHGLADLALSAPVGAGGLSLLPYLDGERTPNLPTATGTLGGITRSNATPANVARAAVEGMLANLAAGIGGLRGQGVDVQRVLLIGGAAASPAVRAVAATLFGVPVSVPEPGEYVAVGAARQAAWALSGGDEPPGWRVPTAATLDPADLDAGRAVVERYEALRSAVHG